MRHYLPSEVTSGTTRKGGSVNFASLLVSFLFLFVLTITVNGQTTIFQFTFEDVLTPVIDNAVGTPSFTSNGVGGLAFNATTPCEGSKMYQGSYWTIGDYYQFTVNTTGYSNITFSYCERGSNTLIGTFQVRVSPDGNNWTTVLADYTPQLTNTTKTTSVFPAACENVSTVYIQIYKTSSPTSTGQSLRLDNGILTGSMETSPPAATFLPANGASGVLINVQPTITFNEPVFKTNGTAVTNSDLASLISFKKSSSSGVDVPFTATIDATSKIITIVPAAQLDYLELYYLAVAPVEDALGNEAGTQSATFTTMTNTLSNDATLSDLKVSGTTIAGFAPSTLSYNYELPFGTITVPTVTATPNFGLATYLITPASALPGTTTILVTAQDGVTQLTYTVNFTITSPSSNADLSYLRWIPNGGTPAEQSILVTGFSSATTTYAIEVPAEVTTLSLVAAVSQSGASVVITPPSNLLGTLSQRTGTAVVTAQDGATIKTYSVVFTVSSGNAFHFKEGFATFPPANWTYTGNISLSTSNGVGLYSSGLSSPKFKWTTPTDGGILISPACNSAGTLVFFVRVLDNNLAHELHLYVEKSLNGGTSWTTLSTDPMPMTGTTTIWNQVTVPVNDNSSGLLIRLRGSANTGTTSLGLFYIDDISLTMNSASDATLSDLRVSGSTISGFTSAVLAYNVILPAGTVIVPVVTATATQPTSTVQISPAASIPGTTSVLVTAPDGITTKTYSISFSNALAAPTNLTATRVSSGQVNLYWTDTNNNEDGTSIERKPENGLFGEVARVNANVITSPNYTPGLNPNDFVPADRFSAVTVTSGVKFADVTNYKGVPTSLYLDVYEPTGDNTLGRPVIIWIHGGGFRTDSYRTQGYIVDYCTRFAKRGYICLSIDYRLRQGADMPTQASEFPALQDAARDANAAINWVKANAATYHVDPNLIFIAGGSAGGRTAQTVCQFDGPDPTALYPPETMYLTTPWDKTGLIANATLWGGLEPEMRDWVYPYLQPTDIPTILVHGTADVTILPQNSIDLNDTLTSTGVTSELHLIPGATHSCLGHETEISAWVAAFFAQQWSLVNASTSEYSYRARAFNTMGYSPYSEEASTAKKLMMRLLMEGLYSGNGKMRKTMDENGSPNFSGATADTLSIELRNASTGLLQYAAHGVKIDTTGNLAVTLPSTYTGPSYVYLRHRNSILTSTANPITFSSPVTNYIFDAASKAFSNNLLEMTDGYYTIYGGDISQDGLVDGSDLSPVDNQASAFSAGYMAEDVNGDGLVDGSDLSIVDNNSSNFISSSTPY